MGSCYNRIRQKATTKDPEYNDTPDGFTFDVLKAVFALYAAGSIADSGALEQVNMQGKGKSISRLR